MKNEVPSSLPAAGRHGINNYCSLLFALFLAATSTLIALPAQPTLATPLASCPVSGVHASSLGVVVDKAYSTASMCLQPAVDAKRVMRIDGHSVDGLVDGVCVRPELLYRTSPQGTEKPSSILFPTNCTGGRVDLSAPSVSGVSYAALRVCILRATTASVLSCSTPAQFYPSPPPKPFGPR